ncbi:C163A-like protein [Mya arenaria]|uniref:C163A-like protein n=1 Tax=Mya arenaria TaxID=6604 RepID=A0ABY7G4L4_MYAAR|nr:C163A-like protein [Mya arenaria]
MRPALLCLLFCSTVLRATEGSRLRRLEADVKLLKTFIFGELTSIRDEVKEISNRVDILENNTVTHDPSSPNQEKNITFYNLGDKTGESGKTLQSSMLTCNEDFIANNGRIKDGYYYPCAKDIRLANVYPYRSTGVQGRLEVRHDRKWGTVCDDSFQSNVGEPYITNNVNMVCRMFGFRECQYMLNAVQGRGSGDIWMNYVRCDGQSSFLDCPHEGWGNGGCTHYEDIGFRMWN